MILYGNEGYYTQLRSKYKPYDDNNTEISVYNKNLLDLEPNYQVITKEINAIQEEIDELTWNIINITNIVDPKKWKNSQIFSIEYTDYATGTAYPVGKIIKYDDSYYKCITAITQNENTSFSNISNKLTYNYDIGIKDETATKIATRSMLIEKQKKKKKEQSQQGEKIDKQKQKIEELQRKNKKYMQQIQQIHRDFYNKYYRFIQEGTWQDESYIDADKYYLDAINVAYQSAMPKISYDIKVISINALPEYANKVFDVGDICYIQDTTFLGYNSDGITPIKIPITISEITSNFDSPEKDTIKVQTYRTQFDDLFQRITATTQSLQYNEGSYKRSMNAVALNGSIDYNSLDSTIKKYRAALNA